MLYNSSAAWPSAATGPTTAGPWGLFLTVKGEKLIRDLKRSVKQHDRQFVSRLEPGERRELLRLLANLSG